MSCITSLLDGICSEIERVLKPKLGGTQGQLISEFLPQVWAFETEHETVTLVVGRRADVFVQAESRARRDVTVRWKHDHLATVLRTKSVAHIPPGERPTMVFHTDKGRAAFEYLKRHDGFRDGRHADSPQRP